MLKKIAIFHRGALGDFLLCCPIFEGLSRLWGKKIVFWTRPSYRELVEYSDFFGGFFSSDNPFLSLFFDDSLWKRAFLPEALEGIEKVIFFGRSSLTEVSKRFGKRFPDIKSFWICSIPEDNLKVHLPLFIAEQVKNKFFIDEFPIKPFRVNHNPKVMEEAKRIIGSSGFPIFIHPGSGGLKKIWPFKRWLGLVKWLKETLPSSTIFIVVGPDDEVVMPLVRRIVVAFDVKVLKNLSLSLLSSLLSLGKLYVGNDSGVSHLAAASGAPSIVIFGSTDPVVWAPWGEKVKIIKDSWRDEEIPRLEENFEPPTDLMKDQLLELLGL